MRRGMNSMEMQKDNRILVFKTLQEKGMMTRAELAVELNLQKATITNIINEEAAAYFSGQKSAEDVAKIIQSRMQVYLSETK